MNYKFPPHNPPLRPALEAVRQKLLERPKHKRWKFKIIPPWAYKDPFERQVAQDLIDCEALDLEKLEGGLSEIGIKRIDFNQEKFRYRDKFHHPNLKERPAYSVRWIDLTGALRTKLFFVDGRDEKEVLKEALEFKRAAAEIHRDDAA